MSSIVICGDSQSVYPGQVAEKLLKAAGHSVLRVSNQGRGPDDYVKSKQLWGEYLSAVRDAKPDLIVLLFGTNDPANDRLRVALGRFKNDVAPKVILSGPPRYPEAEQQAKGEAIRAIYVEVFGDDFFDAYEHTPLTIKRDAHGLHFTLKGAEPWGRAVADEALRRLG